MPRLGPAACARPEAIARSPEVEENRAARYQAKQDEVGAPDWDQVTNASAKSPTSWPDVRRSDRRRRRLDDQAGLQHAGHRPDEPPAPTLTAAAQRRHGPQRRPRSRLILPGSSGCGG
jgi:hypothetical protein